MDRQKNISKKKILFLFGCFWLFLFYDFSLRTSDSVIIPYLMRAWHMKAAGLGVLSAGNYLMYIVMQIPAGILIDRFNFKYVISIAVLIVSMGGFIFGSTNYLSIAVIARMLMGGGSAFAFIACMKLCGFLTKESPKQPAAFLIGITMTVGMLGLISGQVPWLYVTNLLSDWRRTYYLTSLIGFALAFTVFFTIPKSLSFEKVSQKLKTQIADIAVNVNFFLLAFYVAILGTPVVVFAAFWGIPFMTQGWHLSTQLAGSVIAAVWFGGMISPTIFGFLIDLYPNIRKTLLISIGMLCAGILLIILFLPIMKERLILLSICLFLMGCFAHGNVIVFSLILEHTNKKNIGLISGMFNMFSIMGAPIFQFLVGVTLSFLGGVTFQGVTRYSLRSYQIAFIVLPVLLILASLSLFKLKYLPKKLVEQ